MVLFQLKLKRSNESALHFDDVENMFKHFGLFFDSEKMVDDRCLGYTKVVRNSTVDVIGKID